MTNFIPLHAYIDNNNNNKDDSNKDNQAKANPLIICHDYLHQVLQPVESCSVVVEDEDDYIVLFDEEAYLLAARCNKPTTTTTATITFNKEEMIDERCRMEIDGRFLKQLLRSQCFSEYVLSLHPNHDAAAEAATAAAV